MGDARFQRFAMLILVPFATAFLSGCSRIEGGKCISESMRFNGIGSLPSVPQGMSKALAVSEANIEVFGMAADRHAPFDEGTAAIGWAPTGTTPNLLHGTGLENLGYRPDADLTNPLVAIARSVTGDGRAALGSTTSGSAVLPARWGPAGNPELLPLLPGAVSGEALAGGILGLASWFPFLAGGYVSPAAAPLSENSPRQAVVWIQDAGSAPLAITELVPPHGSTWSAQANAVWGGNVPISMKVLGEEYDPVAGKAATLGPCAWLYEPNPVIPTQPGKWKSSILKDDSGASARGTATCISPHGDMAGGSIVKNSVVTPCRWSHAGGSWSPAQILPTLDPTDEAHVTAIAVDNDLTVGYELTSSGSVAVVWTGGVVHRLADFLNAQQPNTVPDDWNLLQATAMAGNLPVSTPNLTTRMAIVGFGEHGGRTEGWVLEIAQDSTPWYTCIVPKPVLWPIVRDRPFPWLPVPPSPPPPIRGG